MAVQLRGLPSAGPGARCSLALVLLCLVSRAALAAWPTDPYQNIPFCTSPFEQSYPMSVPDGAGGAVVGWLDFHDGLNNPNINVQHLLADGVVDPGWPAGGTRAVPARNFQVAPVSVSDGAGGAIIAWADQRNGNYDIYAQHIAYPGYFDDSWHRSGQVICAAPGDQVLPAIVPDGYGGAIVAWMDHRGVGYDIYAQHVTSTGRIQSGWQANGNSLCTASGDQWEPALVTDGGGGAIVAWSDWRIVGDPNIYVQHVAQYGAVGGSSWTSNGTPLCTAPGSQLAPVMAADGSGGAIVAWDDARSGSSDVYAHHIRSTGLRDPLWPANGAAVCDLAGVQGAPSLLADGSGGALVAWEDSRSGVFGIYAHHLQSNGVLNPAWPSGGLALCEPASDQRFPTMVPDLAGGAIVGWRDGRSGAGDVYAQHLVAGGSVDPTWPAAGVPVCTAPNEQGGPVSTTDGYGGAMFAWMDGRNGAENYDIYAQHLLSSGVVDPSWRANGSIVCSALGVQGGVAIVQTDYSSAMVVWQDERYGDSTSVVYAQACGGGECTVGEGVTVGTWSLEKAQYWSGRAKMVTDDAGGAFIVWPKVGSAGTQYPSAYAQHVLANGNVDPRWPEGGVALGTHQWWVYQRNLEVIPDGSGGIIAAWYQAPIDVGFRAQHVRADGTLDPAWPAMGVGFLVPTVFSIVVDGTGGAIVAWERNGGGVSGKHLLATGAVDPAWPPEGQVLCAAAGFAPICSPDGAGGAIVAWYGGTGIYAQRVLASGVVDPGWPIDGLAVCTAADTRTLMILTSDGLGGTIVTWRDRRGGTFWDVYAQRILWAGAVDPRWPADGLAVCSATNVLSSPTSYPTLCASVPDGAGGVVVSWEDFRTGTDRDIYAQRVLVDGTIASGWPAGGQMLSGAVRDQQAPTMVSAGADGAIVAWMDARNVYLHEFTYDYTNDLYAQRVRMDGQLGGNVLAVPFESSAAFALEPVRPNPSRGGPVAVRFSLASAVPASVELFDVTGRRLASREVDPLGPGHHVLDLGCGRLLEPGIYMIRLRSGTVARSTRFVVLR